ncbi:DNA damage-induced apoptosis suppressor protein [Engystomops pustulosus]|uniref:DNA damage-induced apoptosis suppressor protein n=1 Tax=Engystomops pustulosus TaxID=76066 RepID=UPI003AFA30AE
MNGRRRFLLGTVLSIQSSSFTYPACQNCCSRLTLTSCRYECRRCGTSYKDATHRYKLCVKVSEERTLHHITIFGKCLEKIFGASADSLHSHLQGSSELCGDPEHDRAQELMFQAAERCLIGRSFVFAVKVPENYHRSDSLVACQIIHLDEDPMSCTVLNYFTRLSTSTHTKTNVSTDSTNQDLSDLGFSESSCSLHQSGNRYGDYWQQSLGLVSSPLSVTGCNSRQGDCSSAEQDPYPGALMSPSTTLCMQKHSCSTPRVNCSPSRYADPNSSSPPRSPHLHSFSSKSKTALGQESYLQKSGSCRSQSRSAHTTQLPPAQTAEIHQAKEEIWEEFPFSESLSEFIAKIEDGEGGKPHFTAKESKEGRLSDVRECRRPSHSMNVPDLAPLRNLAIVQDPSRDDFDRFSDEDSSTFVVNHLCSVTRGGDTGLSGGTLHKSADLSSVQKSFKKCNSFDLSRSREQDPPSPLYPKVFPYVEDSLGMCSFIEDLDSQNLQVVDEEPKSSDAEAADATAGLTSDHYNASADLFEGGHHLEDSGRTSQSGHTGSMIRGHGRLMVPLTSSPCTDVLPYRHRGSLANNYETTIEDLAPYLQSTPALGRLSETGSLSIDPWRFNMASSSKSCIVSIRTKSSITIRHVLLKNLKTKRKSMFYGSSDNSSPWSPNLSLCDGSMLLSLKYRRATLAHKSWNSRTVLEMKDDHRNPARDHTDEPTCTDSRSIGEHLENMENLSPVTCPTREGEDQCPPVQEQLLSSDWSPELFSAKSNISHPSDCLQRRLF